MDLEKRMSSEEFKKFVTESFFTVRRTSKYFSGTWTDMVIEQDLMRAIKVSGGLKNGKRTATEFVNKFLINSFNLKVEERQIIHWQYGWERYHFVSKLSTQSKNSLEKLSKHQNSMWS